MGLKFVSPLSQGSRPFLPHQAVAILWISLQLIVNIFSALIVLMRLCCRVRRACRLDSLSFAFISITTIPSSSSTILFPQNTPRQQQQTMAANSKSSTCFPKFHQDNDDDPTTFTHTTTTNHQPEDLNEIRLPTHFEMSLNRLRGLEGSTWRVKKLPSRSFNTNTTTVIVMNI